MPKSEPPKIGNSGKTILKLVIGFTYCFTGLEKAFSDDMATFDIILYS